MEFKTPWILLLMPFVLGGLYVKFRKQADPAFRYSSLSLFKGIASTWKVRFSQNLYFLRLLAVALMLAALAGPRQVLDRTEITTEGIDIILAVDASGSMAALDFELMGQRADRLTVVKDVVKEFVQSRSADRIGLVVFAGKAYTVCPLTTDYEWLRTNLQRVEMGLLGQDGTAIGSALASSIGRLKESSAKSKVIILLTDGVNNTGSVKPVEAAQAANALGIKVYTIGAGSDGYVPFPVQDLLGRVVYQKTRIPIDEETLREIAKVTDGLYFRATDTNSLRKVYQRIDQMEKTKIEETGYREYKELFKYFLAAGLCLFLTELFLLNTILMKVP